MGAVQEWLTHTMIDVRLGDGPLGAWALSPIIRRKCSGTLVSLWPELGTIRHVDVWRKGVDVPGVLQRSKGGSLIKHLVLNNIRQTDRQTDRDR